MRFKTDWASLIVGRKVTVFALFYFVYENSFQVQAPSSRGGGGGRGAYIWRGDLTEGLLRYEFGVWGGGFLSEFYGIDCNRLRGRMKKYIYFICRLIIMNKPQSNLPSGDTSIQGTLSLAPRVSLE